MIAEPRVKPAKYHYVYFSPHGGDIWLTLNRDFTFVMANTKVHTEGTWVQTQKTVKLTLKVERNVAEPKVTNFTLSRPNASRLVQVEPEDTRFNIYFVREEKPHEQKHRP